MNEDISRNFLDDFYTPDDIASSIANWLIRDGGETVLEPAAGGGALISAAIKRGKELAPYKNLHFLGFDIDIESINKLKKFGSVCVEAYQKNFLDTADSDYFKVDAVLANPPFSRNQSIDKIYREELRRRFGVKGAIGVWGFFLLHSLSYLKPGGRLACIVPKSACFTSHGKQFLSGLANHFDSIGIYEFQAKPKWSKAALENGAVILADKYQIGKAKEVSAGVLKSNGKVLPKEELGNDFYKTMLENSVRLESFADVSIGLVTGRNKVFLLSKREALDNDISQEDLLPTLSRRRHLSGIFFDENDFLKLDGDNEKIWLLLPSKSDGNAKRYLEDNISHQERESTTWFRKRHPWWKVQVGKKCDAAFTYMNHEFPFIARMYGAAACTNTLHQIFFKKEVTDKEIASILLTPISTFGQISAEIIGRSYGGGVLKFELSEVKLLPIIPAKAFKNFPLDSVDDLMKKGDLAQATMVVDEVVMSYFFGDKKRSALLSMKENLNILRERRRGGND